MRIVSHHTDGASLVIRTQDGVIAITPSSVRASRIRYRLGSELSAKPSLAVVTGSSPEPPVPFSVEERADELLLRTGAMTIVIDRRTVAFTYRAADGTLLTREPSRGGKHLDPIDVLVSVFDGSTLMEQRGRADGVRIDALDVRQVVDRTAFHAKVEFEWTEGEAIYGLGSHEEGMFNLRGQHQFLYQENLKVAVPVLMSTRGYGVFLDCTSLVTFHDDPFGSYLWADVVDELDYYIVVGPEFDDIIAELRHLTGQAPMLPRWSFGYLQSKERYQTQVELIEVAREYRQRGLPLDCVVLDWKSWTGEWWGQKSLDPERFPDPRGMVDTLHGLGVRIMISIWPILRPGGEDWRELLESGHLLGNQATYDAFDPEARAMYWCQAERGLFRYGIDAWWSDCTEPFEADWSGALKPEPEERLRINTNEAKRYLDPALINGYSLAHSEGIYAGQRSVCTDRRVLNLTRSGSLGQQRYGTVTWSGDVTATWETLRRQIADGLNFCATGLPYWTTDVGGFFVGRKPDLWFWAGDFDDGVADLGYRELYLRWFQYAAWLPMFRSHGTDTPREIWQFGDAGDTVYEALAQALQLRYRLLPYIYSLAGWTTQRAYTMLRALPFDFRDDRAVQDVGDQFMLGPAFLVCPVHRPCHYGPGSRPIDPQPTTRPVYLPANATWFDFWTDERLIGGQTIDADGPLERDPVFVRAGSIVPMGPVRQHVDDAPDAPLEVHVYPGRDATFTLYSDEGDGYGYEDGAFAVVELTWDDTARRLAFGRRIGEYPGMSQAQSCVVVLHDGPVDPETAGAGPHTSGRRTVRYAGDPVVVQC